VRVRIVVALAWVDAGRERPLSPGDIVEVSPVIGRRWMASGQAVAERPGPTERKPAHVAEMK